MATSTSPSARRNLAATVIPALPPPTTTTSWCRVGARGAGGAGASDRAWRGFSIVVSLLIKVAFQSKVSGAAAQRPFVSVFPQRVSGKTRISCRHPFEAGALPRPLAPQADRFQRPLFADPGDVLAL